MIAALRGKVVYVGEKEVLLETSAGITFSLKVPLSGAVSVGDEVRFHVHTIFNQQNGFELYGFLDTGQLNVFRSLLEVPGIGPAMALRILQELTLNDLATAVRTGNVSILKRVKGLGTKKAEMVIFALKDAPLPEIPEDEGISEALQVLSKLGMDYTKARKLVKEAIRKGVSGVEDLIKYALKENLKGN
ncbi:MAG: hypothetical protein GXO39_07505 [Thermotogae bacterium]|nr:hypothetical protein [Thermotogota bacterium]